MVTCAAILGIEKRADPMTRQASLPAEAERAEFQFERPDWTLFRNAETLAQKAGVRKRLLRRLVLKELVDNALDSGATEVEVEELGFGAYKVRDNGPGIVGDPDHIAKLFSVNRPLISSKLWRMPSRGAMGNGLRVVVGAVAASDGMLRVATKGKRYTLRPLDDGSTAIDTMEPAGTFVGTEIEVTFGPALPADAAAMIWAEMAIAMAGTGSAYAGRPSPWWYDADAFFELLQGAGDRPVREFIEQLDGCTGAKAGKITKAHKGWSCRHLNRQQAVDLLIVARHEARQVSPQRIDALGRFRDYAGYACQRGVTKIGGREPKAEIPFVVDAWASAGRPERSKDSVGVAMYVNRTPAVASIEAWRTKGTIHIHGCGLAHQWDIPAGTYDISINLTTPWCPVTTDGKQPDLSPFVDQIATAVSKAMRQARSGMPKQSTAEDRTQKDIILRHLAEGVEKASGGGLYRFNQRQLFYVLRPFVITALGVEPSWENFTGIITDHEAENGDIKGMYRDPRGTLYHPHIGQDISLGTLAVEQYERPTWTFGQILYLEKEGFFEALKAARWPERHDCALVTSKGFTTRAVRDLLDLLGDGDEPIRVFCVHDADAFGTMIFQTLQEETKARAARRVEVINLGLDPWEALAMDLEPERVKEGDRAKAVAGYVTARRDGLRWKAWLQTTRVELNEMTTPQLIAWLDGKMAEHGVGKVIPPTDVIADEADQRLTAHVRRIVTDRVLREAGIDEQVASLVATIEMPPPNDMADEVTAWVETNEDDAWSDGVAHIVETVAAQVPR